LILRHANNTLVAMMSRRTIKIVAIVLSVIAALVFILGYDFVQDRNFRPKESTLDLIS